MTRIVFDEGAIDISRHSVAVANVKCVDESSKVVTVPIRFSLPPVGLAAVGVLEPGRSGRGWPGWLGCRQVAEC